MKEFKKNKDGLFICEECGKECNKLVGLVTHIVGLHNRKEYYDKWILDYGENLCKTCGKETEYNGRWARKSYNKYCCKMCENLAGVTNETKEKIKITLKITCQEKYNKNSYVETKEFKEKNIQTCLKKYGVDNVSKVKKFKNKSKQTCLEKYGYDVASKSNIVKNITKHNNLIKYGYEYTTQIPDIINKIKQTNLIKYGKTCSLHTIEGKLKAKQTCLKKYGVTHQTKSITVKEKIKQTNLKNYGVEYPSQNLDFFEKHQKNRFLRIEYNSSNVWYQGTYELDFLNNYYNKYSDICRAPSIKYIMNNKNKVYFPDFYIPSLNLIIEIKNSYLVNKYKEEIELKEKATIDNGFNYIIIIDKDYTKFNELIFT